MPVPGNWEFLEWKANLGKAFKAVNLMCRNNEHDHISLKARSYVITGPANENYADCKRYTQKTEHLLLAKCLEIPQPAWSAMF